MHPFLLAILVLSVVVIAYLAWTDWLAFKSQLHRLQLEAEARKARLEAERRLLELENQLLDRLTDGLDRTQ